MQITIDTESQDFKKMIEKSVVKSNVIQDQIDEILQSKEINQILSKMIKEIIMTAEIHVILIEKLKDYITEEYDVSDNDKVISKLNESVKQCIIKIFES